MMTSQGFAGRVRTLVIAFVIVFMLFGVRLIDVQAVQSGGYTKRANNEMITRSVLLAPRGAVTDINGVVLARSEAAENIVVDQTMISDPATTAQVTAAALGMPVQKLQDILTGTKRYRIVENAAAPIVWDNLQSAISTYNHQVLATSAGLAKRIVGFFSERTYTRNYPTGTLAASNS